MNDILVELYCSIQFYERTVAPSNIGEPMSEPQTTVELTPVDHSDPRHWLNLGNSFFSSFGRTGDLSDIAESISAYQRAVDLTPPDHPDLPSSLNNLGNSFLRRFERTKDPTDIASSIFAHQKAVELTDAELPSLCSRLNSLGSSFLRRFELTVRLTHASDPHLPGLHSNLGFSFVRRYEHTGDPSDIVESISAYLKAFELTPASDPALPGVMSHLAKSFVLHFDHTGDVSDLTKSISAYQGAVYLTPSSHQDLPCRLNSLGNSFARRHRCTGDPSDIAKSILAHQRAVNLTAITHPDLPHWLINLGNLCLSRFESTHDLSDVAQAISAYQSAVEFTPAGDTDLPGRLSCLGRSLWSRFDSTGDLSDIAESILAHQKAVELTNASHPDLPNMLSSLGRSFYSRFHHTDDLSDIAESIFAYQRAVDLTPAGHPDLPNWLNNLGNSFARRFALTRNLSDISKSISAQKRAVEIAPADDPNILSFLNNLAILFAHRFECTGDLSDIAESISVHRRAVELTPAGHPSLPSRLNNLGQSFLLRFENTGDDSDIVESISANQKAVELTPAGHPDLPGRLGDLGSSFLRRFQAEHAGNLSNNAESIPPTRGAVELTPARQTDLPHTPDNRIGPFHHHPLSTGSHDDLNTSISYYMSAAIHSYGPPFTRMHAALLAAQLLYVHLPDSPQILTAFDTAIRMISQIATLDQTIQHRHMRLQKISGFPSQAAACGCSLGRVDKALEWLEQGRCLVWTHLNNLRTQLVDLRTHDENLAQRILVVSRRLENAGSHRDISDINKSISDKISAEDEARTHLELAKEWEKLLSTVRGTVPGFENFLQPFPCSILLQHLPDSGPIILINVHEERCDAIALLAGLNEPFHIPLPNFSLRKASTYSNELTDRLKLTGLRMRAVLADLVKEEDAEIGPTERAMRPSVRKQLPHEIVCNILGALWNEVVKPVLDALAFSRSQSSSNGALPRIWWCPTGPVSFLPLHAAGIYTGKDEDSILNYAVSSYTPSITLLADRLKNDRPIDPTVSGLFLTSQPNAPGLSPIPGTIKEVASIHKLAEEHGVRVMKFDGSIVTVDTALEYMEEFSCIHLACHASQNQKDPLQSQFRLHNGSLDLSRIIQKNLKNADLAFLSACQTSAGEERLSEEVVHLAAGMLAAGYRRVVATMWAIGDRHAPEVATDFYDYLLVRQVKAEGGGFDGSDSAHALHHAIQKLRQKLDNSERSLLAWIPYVHFGL
ncbi:hypothetical protein H1R20_g9147, partial [Candolleomyces eurysporus]